MASQLSLSSFDNYTKSLEKSPLLNYLNHLQAKFQYYFKVDYKKAKELSTIFLRELPLQYLKHSKDFNENFKEYFIYSLLDKFPITSNIDPKEFPCLYERGGNFYFYKRNFKDKFVIIPTDKYLPVFISFYLFNYKHEDPLVFKTWVLSFIGKTFTVKDSKQRFVIQNLIEIIFIYLYKISLKKRVSMKSFYSAFLLYCGRIRYTKKQFYKVLFELGIIRPLKTNFLFTRKFMGLYYKFLQDLFRRFDIIRVIDYKTYRKLNFIEF